MSHATTSESSYEDSLLFVNAAAGENPFSLTFQPLDIDLTKKRGTLSLRRCGVPYSFDNLTGVVCRFSVDGGAYDVHTITGSYDVYSLIAYVQDYCDHNDYYSIDGAGAKQYYFGFQADAATGRVVAYASGTAAVENIFDLSSSTLSADYTATLGYALGFAVDTVITSNTGAPDVPVRETAALRPRLTNNRDVLLLYIPEVSGQSYMSSSAAGSVASNPFEVISINSGPAGIITVPETQTRLNMELMHTRIHVLNFKWMFTDGTLIDFNGEAWNACFQLRVFN